MLWWTRHAEQRLAERFDLRRHEVSPACSRLAGKVGPVLGSYRIVCPAHRMVLVCRREMVLTVYSDSKGQAGRG